MLRGGRVSAAIGEAECRPRSNGSGRRKHCAMIKVAAQTPSPSAAPPPSPNVRIHNRLRRDERHVPAPRGQEYIGTWREGLQCLGSTTCGPIGFGCTPPNGSIRAKPRPDTPLHPLGHASTEPPTVGAPPIDAAEGEAPRLNLAGPHHGRRGRDQRSRSTRSGLGFEPNGATRIPTGAVPGSSIRPARWRLRAAFRVRRAVGKCPGPWPQGRPAARPAPRRFGTALREAGCLTHGRFTRRSTWPNTRVTHFTR